MTLLMSTLHFLAAYSLTWISYTGPVLESVDTPLRVPPTKAQMNFVTSVMLLGSIVSSLATGQLPELLGRKKTELIAGLICALAWALIVTAKSINQMLAARFLMGFGCGIHFVVIMTYINEISQSFIRGTMASIPLFSFSIGCLVSYITGWVCSYEVIGYLNLSTCVLFVVLVNFLKESPVYLISKKQDKEALAALQFYRGDSKATVAVLEEFEHLKKQQESSMYAEIGTDEVLENNDSREEKDIATGSKEMSPWKTLVTSKSTQRGIIVLTTHIVLSCFMGSSAVQAYAGHFFLAAAPDISPHLCSVILAVAIVAGNAIAVLGTDLFGRRVLMISSCAVCTICLAVLVTLLRWSWAPDWAVPLVMLLYPCAFQAGVQNVPMVQLSECFMPNVKGIASSIVITCNGLSCFVLLSVFGVLVELLGLDGTFLLFCTISALTTVLAFFTVKETKGIPLEEIQAMYERGYFYWQ
ncbi:hypothetical protein ABMA27_009229 [Loxostege sticticalis]|uniref:Major facilitator superfamily (MFS) profile domain-containing protein n=1 Tax=Loxostege sticticalis TaxID=481309 RepID=A0ABR3HAE0_LOXSC